MALPLLIINTSARPEANNGNWQTTSRWVRLLQGHYRVRIANDWHADQDADAAAMLALHARRSANAAQAWAQVHPGRGLGVVLTGTDLYGDIQTDAAAQRSLALAQRLVVLQDMAPQALPVQYRDKARAIFQSTSARQTLAKGNRHLRAVMVGHMREEKSPQTLFEAARILASHRDIHIDHIGTALDPLFAEQACQTAADCPNYRWLGGLDHETTRRRIQRAHVLVHCSRMEGGAHVLMEAICSGTPVLASQVPGNIGMLGVDYDGFFPWGDAQALVRLLLRCRQEGQGGASFFSRLQAQCRLRAPLFEPAAERRALLALLQELTA
jgi:putative glycosyltransferase (TIGR04348 family)